MKDYARKRRSRLARRMEGDARTVLTLLCVGVFFVAVTSLSYLLRAQDNLIIFVPKDAKAYVHYRRLPWNDYALLKKAFAIPANLEPREAAIFSRQDENGDLMWSTLLMWDSEEAIRIDERLTLNEIASMKPGRNTFLIGKLDIVQYPDQSLAHSENGRALNAMLSVSRAQAMFSPNIFVSAQYDVHLPSQTFVASLHEKDHALIVSMQTAASARDNSSFLGMQRTVSDQTNADFSVPESATVSISYLGTPAYDAMHLLFADLKDLTTAFGTPLNDALRDAESELRLLLSRPSKLTLLPDIDGATEFVLHYPTIEATVLMDAVSRYMQVTLPDSDRITLPDGDFAWELKIDPEAYTFEPVIGMDKAKTLVSDTGILLIIAEAPSGGTLVSAYIDPLNAYLQEEGLTINERCGELKGSAIYFNSNPKEVFTQLDIPGNPLATLDITDVYVSKTGENSLFFCGLIGDNVDNSKKS